MSHELAGKPGEVISAILSGDHERLSALGKAGAVKKARLRRALEEEARKQEEVRKKEALESWHQGTAREQAEVYVVSEEGEVLPPSE